MSRWDEHRVERRARILEAARRMVAREGYAGISMRALARESGVSVPTIYSLCGDKDRVISLAVEGRFAVVLEALAQGADGRGADRVLAIVDGCAREVLRFPDYSRAILSGLMHSPELAGTRDAMAAALSDGLEEVLREMKQGGEMVEWADERAVAEQISLHMDVCAIGWQGGYIDEESFPAKMTYGAALNLLAVSCDEARRRLTQVVQRTQKWARIGQEST